MPPLPRDIEREDTVPSYEPIDDSNSAEEAAWKICAERVWTHEEITIAKWNAEIDTLLVFAGLFSAVLTAFNVQYFQALQSDQTMQWTLNAPSGLVNQISFPIIATSTGQPVDASTIVINTLWFLALVFSLAAASVGISVKQWLASYIPPESITPRQRARIWHLRRRGLRRWRVPEIVGLLPVLLRLALVLFLVGMVVLLWTLNRAVAIIVMVPVVVLLVLSTAEAVIPTFAPDCPYKSPQAWWVYRLLHRLTCFDGTVKRRLLETRHQFVARVWGSVLTARDWLERENNLLRAQPREQISVAVPDPVDVLFAADQVVRDDQFLQAVILPAFQKVDTSRADFDATLRTFYQLVQARAHIVSPIGPTDSSGIPNMSWFKDEMDSGSVIAMVELTMDMLFKIAGELRPNATKQARDMSRILTILQALLAALPRSQYHVFVRLIEGYCDDGYTYRPVGACQDDAVELIAQHAVRFKANILDVPTNTRAILGAKAINRLEQVLEDPKLDSFRARNAERDILRLIGVLLDNRKRPVTQGSETMCTRLCHLLGSSTSTHIPRGTRTTLLWLVARVATDVKYNVDAVVELVSCLGKLAREPHDESHSSNTMCLCSAIATSLAKLQQDSDSAKVARPLVAVVRELLESVGDLDRYGLFDYMRGLLSVALAVAVKQPAMLTVSDVARLKDRAAACVDNWPQYSDEVKDLRERMLELETLLDGGCPDDASKAADEKDSLDVKEGTVQHTEDVYCNVKSPLFAQEWLLSHEKTPGEDNIM